MHRPSQVKGEMMLDSGTGSPADRVRRKMTEQMASRSAASGAATALVLRRRVSEVVAV